MLAETFPRNNEARELEKICYQNNFSVSWLLKKLKIDRSTFCRWRDQVQHPEPRSILKLHKGITYLQKIQLLDQEILGEN